MSNTFLFYLRSATLLLTDLQSAPFCPRLVEEFWWPTRVNMKHASMFRDLYINAFRARGQHTDQVIVCPAPCYNAPDSVPVREASQYSCNTV